MIQCSKAGYYMVAECRSAIKTHAATTGKNGSIRTSADDNGELKKWTTEVWKFKAKLAEKEFNKIEGPGEPVLPLACHLVVQEIVELFETNLKTIARVTRRETAGHPWGGEALETRLNEEFRHVCWRVAKMYQRTQGPFQKYLIKKK